MKKFLMMLMVVLASSVMFFTDSAEAARIGGGRSVGRQNSTIQRAAPAQQNNAMANNRQQQAAQANNGRRPGFGMGLLGGLAAGLGLSALASAFGLGEGSGIFLLMLLLAGLAIFAFRMFGKRLQQQQQAQAAGSGAPFAGNLRDAFNNSGKPRQNDMFRQNSNAGGLFSQTPAAGAAQAPVGAADTGVSGYTAAMQVPGGFDTEAFVRQAKVQFVRLQAAFDARNADDLREFTSPEMFGELNIDMMQRGSAPQTTEVVELNAELTGMHQEGPILVASVLFSGLIREEPNSPAEPFSEIWNFTRPASGASGWVLAGIQQPN